MFCRTQPHTGKLLKLMLSAVLNISSLVSCSNISVFGIRVSAISHGTAYLIEADIYSIMQGQQSVLGLAAQLGFAQVAKTLMDEGEQHLGLEWLLGSLNSVAVLSRCRSE